MSGQIQQGDSTISLEDYHNNNSLINTKNGLDSSLHDRETMLLSHHIKSLNIAGLQGGEERPYGILDEVEAVVAYCRARVTCHQCHNVMRNGEMFVCLRHGMPSHLQCFQQIMSTTILHIEFPMSLSDIHAVENTFEIQRYVHQHHKIHALTGYATSLCFLFLPLLCILVIDFVIICLASYIHTYIQIYIHIHTLKQSIL